MILRLRAVSRLVRVGGMLVEQGSCALALALATLTG